MYKADLDAAGLQSEAAKESGPRDRSYPMSLSRRNLKIALGLAIGFPPFGLLFLFGELLFFVVLFDYDFLPRDTFGTAEKEYFYDFHYFQLRAGIMWSIFVLIAACHSTYYLLTTIREVGAERLGDWQPLLLHLFLTGVFGLPCCILLLIMSFAGDHS